MIEARKDAVTDGAASPEHAVLADRRRPGRPETVNPELIRLLRTSELKAGATGLETDDDVALDADTAEVDQLSAARGVLWGLAFSIPAWLGMVAVGMWLLR